MKTLIFGTGLSAEKDYNGLMSVCLAAVNKGIMTFDTAPSYGTEKVLGQVLKDIAQINGFSREEYQIQTKIDIAQMVRGKTGMLEHVEKLLRDLGIEYIDTLLIHWPYPEMLDETMKTLVYLKEKEIIKNLGLCNTNGRYLRRLLPEYKVDIVQIERNPLCVRKEEVDLCHQYGVQVQAYSPLCKMHPDISTNEVLRRLAEKYERSIGEIVLRWHIDTGAIPVFTSKNCDRINQYSQIDLFELEMDDIALISKMDKNYKMYLESFACPGY